MEPETYSESAFGATITRERALEELRAHGMDSVVDILDFDEECGVHNVYRHPTFSTGWAIDKWPQRRTMAVRQ